MKPCDPFPDEMLAEFCLRSFRSGLESVCFRRGHLSEVIGVRLADGRKVVVKLRPAECSPHVESSFMVHQHVYAASFPCPEPLVAPTDLGPWVATAERMCSSSAPFPSTTPIAAAFASALALLTEVMPSVDQVGPLMSPPWAAWNHDGKGLWPWPDDMDVDLNEVDSGWLDQVAGEAKRRLARSSGGVVVGHGDWYSGNVLWEDDRLHAVIDWDSALVDRETVIIGLASAVFSYAGSPGDEPTVSQSQAFIDAYVSARSRVFSPPEVEEMWAAGLWVRAFDAKKQLVADGRNEVIDEREALTRLRLAGVKV